MKTINAQSIINEVTAAAEAIKHAAELAGFGYAPEKITPAEIKKDAEFSALAKRAKGCPWGFELEHHAETDIMDVKAYTGARDTFSQLPEIEVQHRWELVRMAFEADAELLQDVPDLCGPEFVTIQTSARGHARIKNTAGNLLAFAAKVRSHAAAFGGGLVRTIKPRAAIVWPAKSVSLFKQLIEDHDYGAALDLAESKLGALFCINKAGRALLQVAPVPVETMPGMVSIMNETGDFSIIEPVSMRCIPGTCKRTRSAQIEAGQRHYDTATPESKVRILSDAESMRVDQAACRAQWMAEHAIDDAQEIQTRIDAQAAQDVAQVVASATAAAAIEQAQDSATLCDLGSVATDTAAQAAQDAVPVLETCYAMADSSATVCEASTGAPGGTGGHGVGFATPAARPVAPVGTGQQIKGKSGHWLARFRVLPDGAPVMDFCSNPGGEYQDWKIRIFETGAERMRALQAMASQADKAAQDAAARLVAPVNPLIDFDGAEGVDCALIDALNMASAADLQSLDAAQFARLVEHLETWNFHTECVMVRALRVGAGNIAKTLWRLVALHQKTGYLTQDLSEQRAALSAEVKALENQAAQDAAARLVAVGVSGSAPTVASTGAKMGPPANLERNLGGYGGAESHSTGSTQAGDPPANLNQKTDGGAENLATVTAKLNDGTVVLAKKTKYGISAYTFSNRSQAQNAAEKHGGEVVQRGRPFFVRMGAPTMETSSAPQHPRSYIPSDGEHFSENAFEAWKYASGSRFGFVMYVGKVCQAVGLLWLRHRGQA